jgi:hypothetical protein
MTVPKYVQELLSRSEWAVKTHWFPKECDPGYTILLHKRTAFALAHSLEREARSLKGWCDRQMKRLDPNYDPEKHSVATIHSCPKTTHHHDQWAVVTIYDPVMKHLEPYIK